MIHLYYTILFQKNQPRDFFLLKTPSKAIIIGMKILEEVIKKSDLANSEFVLNGEMVKAVVDVKKGIIAIDAEMHADLEQFLLSSGSAQDDLWGINLWFKQDGEDFIEFDSMINIRPRQNNRSRDVENPEIREQIKEIVNKWVK